MYYKRSFYQDRLGTSIVNVEGKGRFLAVDRRRFHYHAGRAVYVCLRAIRSAECERSRRGEIIPFIPSTFLLSVNPDHFPRQARNKRKGDLRNDRLTHSHRCAASGQHRAGHAETRWLRQPSGSRWRRRRQRHNTAGRLVGRWTFPLCELCGR